MSNRQATAIKKSQKESSVFREVAKLFREVFAEDKRLKGLSVTQLKLSADKSVGYVYFYAPGGEKDFKEKLKILILYKPSLRKAIAENIKSRYTPNFIFKYDKSIEKQEALSTLFEKIKSEGKF